MTGRSQAINLFPMTNYSSISNPDFLVMKFFFYFAYHFTLEAFLILLIDLLQSVVCTELDLNIYCLFLAVVVVDH